MPRCRRRQLSPAERTPRRQAIHTALLVTPMVTLVISLLCHWTYARHGGLADSTERLILSIGAMSAIVGLVVSGFAWAWGRTLLAAWLCLFNAFGAALLAALLFWD